LGTRLKIGQDAFDRFRPRVAALAQIEDKSRISNNISAKSGGSRFITAQELFHFSKQMHLSFPYRL
jgi:hypothetical protein